MRFKLWSQRNITKGLTGKLARLFLIQVLAISLATLIGVYAAAQVLEKVLIREALEGEANHFWRLQDFNANQTLPNTNNMIGFIAHGESRAHLPEPLRELEPGYHRVILHDNFKSIVHVSDHAEQRLYLVFDQVHVSNLALLFGIAPLTAVLALIYLLVWFGFIRTRRVISPMVRLAHRLETFDFRSDRLTELDLTSLEQDADGEVATLIHAFQDFAERMDAMIQRERNFTRNASHELRTPVTVLRANLELMRSREHSQEQLAKINERMQRTVRDMEALLETLLLLARESESRLTWGRVSLNELLAYQLEQEAKANCKEGVSSRIIAHCELRTSAPEKVLAIVFANLLRNAFSYTEQGEVRIEIMPHAVAIQDTGCGMSETDLNRAFEPFYRGQRATTEGYGLGLAIVNRLCTRFGWELEADSELNAGTRVTIRFPNCQVFALTDAKPCKFVANRGDDISA